MPQVSHIPFYNVKNSGAGILLYQNWFDADRIKERAKIPDKRLLQAQGVSRGSEYFFDKSRSRFSGLAG